MLRASLLLLEYGLFTKLKNLTGICFAMLLLEKSYSLKLVSSFEKFNRLLSARIIVIRYYITYIIIYTDISYKIVTLMDSDGIDTITDKLCEKRIHIWNSEGFCFIVSK